jgi:hypothetical protein
LTATAWVGAALGDGAAVGLALGEADGDGEGDGESEADADSDGDADEDADGAIVAGNRIVYVGGCEAASAGGQPTVPMQIIPVTTCGP